MIAAIEMHKLLERLFEHIRGVMKKTSRLEAMYVYVREIGKAGARLYNASTDGAPAILDALIQTFRNVE